VKIAEGGEKKKKEKPTRRMVNKKGIVHWGGGSYGSPFLRRRVLLWPIGGK